MTHASNFTTQFLSVEAMRYWATMRKTICAFKQSADLHFLPDSCERSNPARALLARLM